MKNTLADVKVEIGIKYSHVLDLSIEAEEGKHAAAHIVLEMEDKITDAEIQSVKNKHRWKSAVCRNLYRYQLYGIIRLL